MHNMKLVSIVETIIPTMFDTPCKIAVFEGECNIKVFQKTMYRNGMVDNWSRNLALEKYGSVNAVIKQIKRIEDDGYEKRKRLQKMQPLLQNDE